jgi:hypothetical protein
MRARAPQKALSWFSFFNLSSYFSFFSDKEYYFSVSGFVENGGNIAGFVLLSENYCHPTFQSVGFVFSLDFLYCGAVW